VPRHSGEVSIAMSMWLFLLIALIAALLFFVPVA